jgi:hypothetical protein
MKVEKYLLWLEQAEEAILNAKIILDKIGKLIV